MAANRTSREKLQVVPPASETDVVITKGLPATEQGEGGGPDYVLGDGP